MAKIIITGSSGFIGSELILFLEKQGHEIYAFQRSKKELSNLNIQFVEYDLNSDLDNSVFETADFCIHTAYSKDISNKNNINISGSIKLIKKCREHEVKFIFLSSLSAQKSITSLYSISKQNIENQINKSDAVILKLGLVIGEGGLFKGIYDFIKKSPFVPIFDGGKQQIQYISIEDVKNVLNLMISNFQVGEFVIIHETSIQNKLFYSRLAEKLGKKIFFISINSLLMSFLLSFTEFLHIKLPVTKENLQGLKQMKPLKQKLPNGIANSEIKSLSQILEKLN